MFLVSARLLSLLTLDTPPHYLLFPSWCHFEAATLYELTMTLTPTLMNSIDWLFSVCTISFHFRFSLLRSLRITVASLGFMVCRQMVSGGIPLIGCDMELQDDHSAGPICIGYGFEHLPNTGYHCGVIGVLV
jgi:hypothetical protein